MESSIVMIDEIPLSFHPFLVARQLRFKQADGGLTSSKELTELVREQARPPAEY